MPTACADPVLYTEPKIGRQVLSEPKVSRESSVSPCANCLYDFPADDLPERSLKTGRFSSLVSLLLARNLQIRV